MALKLKGSTSGFVGLDAPAVAGNNTLILPDSAGSAGQILANDITAGVTTFTQVTVSRNGDLTVPGTISIGGTLTYEDVTSIDSVGIITARSTIDAQGDVSIADKIVHTGDTNTAIRFPAVDTITAETGGTERVRVTSGGDVGVGNNSPNCRLAVKDDTDANAVYANVTPSVGDCIAQLYYNPSSETANDHATLQFGVNGGSQNRVNTISAVAESASNRKMAFTFCTDDSGSRTEKMRITSGGIVGVNTDSPTLNGNEEGIHIVSDEYPTLHLTNMTTGHGSSNGTSLTLNNTGETILRNDHASHIRFDTNGSNERMRITAGGAVLINGQALSDVHTNADDVVIGNTSASLMGLSLVTGTSGYATLQFSDGAGNKNQGQIAYNHSNDSMIFTTNSESVMTIQSTGIVKVEKSDSSGLNAHFLVNNSESSSGLSMLGSGSSFSSGGWAPVSDAGHIRTSAGSANGLVLQASSGVMRFYVGGSPTERMRINSSGQIFFGCTDVTDGGSSVSNNFAFSSDGNPTVVKSHQNCVYVSSTNSADRHAMQIVQMRYNRSNIVSVHTNTSGTQNHFTFYVGNNVVGTVNTNASVTAYNTSSDYRLKENEVVIPDAISKVKKLKPYTFNFKITPDVKYDGFFAHEAQEVAPYAVSGEKDAEDMQSMDYGKLTPLLTAALQEAITKIETLEAKVAALEGS